MWICPWSCEFILTASFIWERCEIKVGRQKTLRNTTVLRWDATKSYMLCLLKNFHCGHKKMWEWGHILTKRTKQNSWHEFIFNTKWSKVIIACKYSTTAGTRLTGGHPQGFLFFFSPCTNYIMELQGNTCRFSLEFTPHTDAGCDTPTGVSTRLSVPLMTKHRRSLPLAHEQKSVESTHLLVNWVKCGAGSQRWM